MFTNVAVLFVSLVELQGAATAEEVWNNLNHLTAYLLLKVHEPSPVRQFESGLGLVRVTVV